MCKQEHAALPAVMEVCSSCRAANQGYRAITAEGSQLCLSRFSDTLRNVDLLARSVVTSFELLA